MGSWVQGFEYMTGGRCRGDYAGQDRYNLACVLQFAMVEIRGRGCAL